MDLALFDFDNTITDRDCFSAFIPYALPKRRIQLAKPLAVLPVLAHKLGLLPATLLRRWVVWLGFRGMKAERASKIGQQFAQQFVDEWVLDKAMEKIRWHQQRGDKVVVVSASLSLYLKPWCKQHGVDLLCSEIGVSKGKLTGRYIDGDCTADNKVRQVKRFCELKDFETIYAYGDSREDLPMLSLADHPIYNWRPL